MMALKQMTNFEMVNFILRAESTFISFRELLSPAERLTNFLLRTNVNFKQPVQQRR